jgi:Cys-rich four helix bundle protein (predicted Tat secretion target)
MSKLEQGVDGAIATGAEEPSRLGRRELLAGAGALAGMAVAGSAWAASDDPHAGHSGHGAAKYSEAKAAKAHKKLVAAANECIATGRACFSHCLETFRGGDTTMADCAWSVEQMMHVCGAFEALASYDSRHLEELAVVCAKVCEDCEKECRVHEEHQPECEACADACAALVKQIRKLSA